MRWTEQIIAAHKCRLSEPPSDRRGELIAGFERYQGVGDAQPAVHLALQLVADGNVNEVELAFYVLMDLALTDPSLRCHVSQLTKHRSAPVRRKLAFYLSSGFPPEFGNAVYSELLRDKAASVRQKTIQTVGMRARKDMMPKLLALRATEQSEKVIQLLDYWIPLLEVGYRMELDVDSRRLLITALTGKGIASRFLDTTDPHDARIPGVVEELRRFP